MAKYIKTTNVDKEVLSLLLTKPHEKYKVNAWNLARILERSTSSITNSFRDLMAEGLIMKSFMGSYHIIPQKEELVKKILAKGVRKFKIED